MPDSVEAALSPTPAVIAGLRLSTNPQIATELLAGTGMRALDIGCGEGKFTRALTRLFAKVVGIDVKERKIAEANAAARAEGVAAEFRTASGEAIPDPDASYDTVVFSNSLHHMPTPRLALAEALRVLKPGGYLYVMEPVPAGNYHAATRLVNDETEVRTQAYRELMALPGAVTEREIMYKAHRIFADFEDWKTDQIDRDAARKAMFDAQPDEVRRRFEGEAHRQEGRLVFDQVYRVNLLRKR